MNIPAEFSDFACYWQSLRDGDELPDRSRVNPSQIIRFLPSIYLAEVNDDGTLKVRLSGTKLDELFRSSAQKDGFEAMICETSKMTPDNLIELLFEKKVGALFNRQLSLTSNRQIDLYRLVFPMINSADGKRYMMGLTNAEATMADPLVRSHARQLNIGDVCGFRFYQPQNCTPKFYDETVANDGCLTQIAS